MDSENSILGLKSKSIFFILLLILLIPSGFFIKMSYSQLNEILININQTPKLEVPKLFLKGDFEIHKVALEHDVMSYRHQRAKVLLATRTWMRFMSLIFGAILIVIGSGFILGRITGPNFKANVSFQELGASVVSSSPGLFLVFFGIILMAIPNVSTQTITTVDKSTYIQGTANQNYDKTREDSVVNDILKNLK